MTQNTMNGRRGSLVLGLVLGGIVGIMVIALAWTLLVPPRTATPAPDATSATPTVTATATARPTATPTPTPTSATPSPTPTATASLDPEVVTSLPPGSWITVLDSLSKQSYDSAQAVARASELGNDQYRAVAIDTDQMSGLNPGYFAVVVPGLQSRQEVTEVCQALGITLGDDCYPRQIQG